MTVAPPAPVGPTPPVAHAHPTLREPFGSNVQRGNDAAWQRTDRWAKLMTYGHPQRVQVFLDRRQLPPLLDYIDHIGTLLRINYLTFSAAAMRQEAPEGLTAQSQAMEHEEARLRVVAAMLTRGDWPATDKLQALQKIQQALKSANTSLPAFTFLGENYLHLACRSQTTGAGLSLLVAFFLREGVDCNATDAAMNTPCHLLRHHNNPIPALVTLLEHGANPNATDAFGYTVMHRLAGHPQAAYALSMCKARNGDLRAVTERGETLLHTLLQSQDEPVAADFLLRLGVSPHARDVMGFNALDYADILNRTRTRPFLGQRGPTDNPWALLPLPPLTL